jgi:hypothetical protein
MGSNINSLSMALVRAIMVDMEQLHKQLAMGNMAAPTLTTAMTPLLTLAHKPLLVTGRTLSHTTSSLMDMVELSH